MALDALLAASPLLATLGLMLLAGWSAGRAAAAGLALALAVDHFELIGGTPATPLLGVGAEAAFQTAAILWILWPALALFQHQAAAGSFDRLQLGLAQLTPSRGLQALLLAWFLALFLEGAAGFGTPAAIVAPLLVAIGMAPLQAVVMALIGHAAGVAFGALGTPLMAQISVTGFSAEALTWPTALLNTANATILMGALWFVARRAQEGPQAGFAISPLAAMAALLAFLGPGLALAAWSGPELPTLGGALVGLAVFVIALSLRARSAGGVSSAEPTPVTGLIRDFAPYLLLVALILATRSIPMIAETLAAADWRWHFGEHFGGEINLLRHPGSLLLVALVVGCLLQGRPVASLAPALGTSARRLLPVALALFAMLALSRLMLHGGMLDVLQTALVAAVGEGWPWLAPALGALGSFVTGSATASNLLFTPLQLETAQELGLPLPWMLAAQGVGAAVGNIICPHNLVAAGAAVGLAGRESMLLRHTLLPCLAVLVVCGALVAGLVRGAG